ncbi:MAG TPA: beta-ketoacyl synthase N-terminal-like domain-containing protein [Streptosporangiaceae bacterium]|nr:beta-ketoacyl synthase N-terminal-like domain-containing protein [Streptosporangiaceae bacterium]
MTGEVTGSLPDDSRRSVAVIGLACRYPDADDAASLLDTALTGRRAFRRIPRGRVDLADYYSPDPGAQDATYSTRAALIEGWRFDRGAFGISESAYASADPAHWLALETAARALAAAGFPGGTDLAGERAGVFMGTTMAGDGSPAAALRLRWPYSRRVMADAMSASGLPAEVAGRVLAAAAERYLAPFPAVTAQTLAGSTPASLATAICRHFGLRGGGLTVDAAGASSLTAMASACLALAAGELDVAVAGGVDLSIDPLDLVGLAKSGRLATSDMRVYDEHPTGFLPGEGCGVVLLMRTADARAASLPVYAEILGWGVASNGQPDLPETDAAAHLLAMRRAHEMAGVDPGDVQLIEGCGAAVQASDHAELTALAALRAGARQVAVLGSISANIGNTGAAAGAAALIKAVLAIANGVLPPSTGVRTPHPMLRDGRAALRLPASPEPWPAGTRHAGVSAVGPDGLAVHLVLRGEPAQHSDIRPPQIRPRALLPRAVQTLPPAPARSLRPARIKAKTAPVPQNLTEPALRLAATRSTGTYPAGPEHPFAYLLQAPDHAAMAAILSRITEIAPWLSDAQLQDLAVHLARTAAADPGVTGQHGVRIALTAAGQEELARRASEAIMLLPELTGSLLTTRPGIFAAAAAGGSAGTPTGGHVALVISGQPDDLPDLPQRQLSRILAILRWLDELGVEAAAAVGHGIGEVAGLVWAGCTTPADARTLTALRSAVLAAPADSAPGQLGSTIGKFGSFAFRRPGRRLISGSTGREVAEPEAIAEMLCAELFEARLGAEVVADSADGPAAGRDRAAASSLAAAIAAAADGAGLLVQTGQDQHLAKALAQVDAARAGAAQADTGQASTAQAGTGQASTGQAGTGQAGGGQVSGIGGAAGLPTVSIDGDPADGGSAAHAAAALFAAGALTRPEGLYARRPSRPVDIWREQVFITHPCESQPAHAEPAAGQSQPQPAPAEPAVVQAGPDLAKPDDTDGGVAPWFRCYTEREQAPALPVPAGDDRPWRLHTGGCEPLDRKAGELFRHDPAAQRTLAILGSLDNAASRGAAVLAARDAISTGQLVAISPGLAAAGLWATLHAEHPSVGITVVRTPLTPDGLVAAQRIAAAAPGAYRELTIGQDGTVAEPVMCPLYSPGGGDFPLGPEDVVLISRGSAAAGLALAQVLACSGATVVVVGREHPDHDEAAVAGLERLRGAGAKVGYELVGLADHAALTAAVRRIEARFGRVTAISHAAGQVARVTLDQLTPARADDLARTHTNPLDQMAAAVRAVARASGAPAGQLRFIVTFGCVTGRYGLAGDGASALVTGAIADYGAQLAAASPGCRALHVDWPAWSGDGLGQRADLAETMERAGFTAMPPEEGSRQLLRLLATEGLSGRFALHGRVGVPAPRPVAAAGPRPGPGGGPGAGRASARFVERIIVHYPGVELIAEASLSLLADPYLGDYQVDGVPVLPPAMTLEAMAQAASALAGAPVRSATDVSMSAPIVLPAGTPGSQTVIRLCAVRDGDSVTVAIRSGNSGFTVDHGRATFGGAQPEHADPRPPAGARSPASTWPAGRPRGQRAGTIPGTELYGPVYFQAGRFRRLATVRLTGPRSAVGIADGPDEQPWFGAVPPQRASGRPDLVLGSAGLSDATLQLVQACVPHRRLILAGCESVWFSGRAAEGRVTILVTQDEPAETGQVADAVPRPRQAPGRLAGEASGPAWNAEVTDAAGHTLIVWRGLRMRDVGPLEHGLHLAATRLADARPT